MNDKKEVEKALAYSYNEYFYDEKVDNYYLKVKKFSLERVVKYTLSGILGFSLLAFIIDSLYYMVFVTKYYEESVQNDPRMVNFGDILLGFIISSPLIILIGVLYEVLTGYDRKYFTEKEIDTLIHDLKEQGKGID